MNRIGAVILGLVSAALGYASRSLWSPDVSGEVIQIGVGYFTLFFYGPFYLTVVGGTVAAFRGIWLSTQRAALSSRMAMGASRRSIVAHEALTGVRDGAIAGGVGLALGAGLRQGITGFAGGHVNLSALADWAGIALLALVCGAAGYGLAATWMTRGSIRQVSSGVSADKPSGPQGTRPRKPRWLLWTGLGLVAVTIAANILVSGVALPQSLEIPLAIIVSLGMYLAAPALLIYGGAVASAHLVAWGARRLRRGAHGASARAIAADGLLRHTSMRAAALLAVGAVVALSTALATTAVVMNARYELSDQATPHGTISTVRINNLHGQSAPGAPGWQPALPANLLDALESDDRLIVVPAGILVTDPRTFVPEFADSEAPITTYDVLLATTRDQINAATPHAGNALSFGPGVEWNGDNRFGLADELAPGQATAVTVNGTSVEVVRSWNATPFAAVDREWAEDHFGPTPTSAVLLYPGSDGISVAGAMSDYDTEDLFSTRGEVHPITMVGPTPAQFAALTAPFLAIAVCVVVALAWATQRTRAKDHATLVALGAQASALRGAAAIEAGVTTAAATVMGLATGAGMAVAFTVLFAAPLSGGLPPLMLWNAGFTLVHVPWLTMAFLAVAAVALAMLGALTIRIRMDRLTPAEQLAEAQKAGVA